LRFPPKLDFLLRFDLCSSAPARTASFFTFISCPCASCVLRRYGHGIEDFAWQPYGSPFSLRFPRPTCRRPPLSTHRRPAPGSIIGALLSSLVFCTRTSRLQVPSVLSLLLSFWPTFEGELVRRDSFKRVRFPNAYLPPTSFRFSFHVDEANRPLSLLLHPCCKPLLDCHFPSLPSFSDEPYIDNPHDVHFFHSQPAGCPARVTAMHGKRTISSRWGNNPLTGISGPPPLLRVPDQY